jgi:hypothetical protein
MVPRVADLEIHQFWTEKLTDVSFLSFPTTHVSPMKKIKTDEKKNRVFKSEAGAKRYLTLFFNCINRKESV